MKFKQAYEIVDAPKVDGYSNPGVTYTTKDGKKIFIPVDDFKTGDCWAWTVTSTDKEFVEGVKLLSKQIKRRHFRQL